MTTNDYQAIQVFLNQSCGIALGENKQYLVVNRLSGLLTKFNLSSFSDLSPLLQSNSLTATKIKASVIDLMTTNETFWFRDDMQFLELKDKIFPELYNKKTTAIKVWSAACSSGQEPYTMSMCSVDAAQRHGKKPTIQIMGTDISESILLEAKSAIYSELALSRGLDNQTRNRFFQPVQNGYKLKEEISRTVRFQKFNLLKPFSILGRFDIIFCRNVLIYFSDEIKKDILTRMVNSLEPGGYIFLSSTESMPASISGLELIRSGRTQYFRKN